MWQTPVGSQRLPKWGWNATRTKIETKVWKPQKVWGLTRKSAFRMAIRATEPTIQPNHSFGSHEPKMQFRVGKMAQAQNGPWYAPCRVSHGPKCSTNTSFVIEGGFNPAGKEHKGD